MHKQNVPSFKEALLFWLKLGFISFGGPAGQISIMHEYVVTHKKWISDARFLNALNYCMLLPGPEAQQLATYLGWLFHGTKGGLTAGILFVLPSLFILTALNIVYVSFGSIAWVSALFEGLKPAVVAIVIVALLKISQKSLKGYFHYLLAVSSFVALFFFNVPFPLIIVSALLIAVFIQFTYPGYLQNSKAEKSEDLNEREYLINSNNYPGKRYHFFQSIIRVLIGIVLWIVPFLLFYIISTDFEFWKTLSSFFTRAALVTFGGAYAVLPYVAQVSVEKLHWLSHHEMIDGLALGETTPGPLIMVLVFVGFMGAYHHYGNSLLHGIAGGWTTAFYTFLPCFVFIFAGAPFIEKIHGNLKIKALMSLITAAVAGVILNLTIYFSKAVVFPEGVKGDIHYLNVAWILISFFTMYRLKLNMILWIAVSACFGLVSYWARLM